MELIFTSGGCLERGFPLRRNPVENLVSQLSSLVLFSAGRLDSTRSGLAILLLDPLAETENREPIEEAETVFETPT